MELMSKHAKESVERGSWGGVLDFMMACLAYSVGLANIWRFPFIFYKNGGGAFLVPFILCTILLSIPLVFLEFSLGQFASLGPLAVWRVAPLFKGIGISTVIVCAMLSLYNAFSLSISVFYMCASWQAQLPWETCSNTWNSQECCVSIQYLENCTVTDSETCKLCTTTTHNASNITGEWKSPQQEYFIDSVLELSPNVNSLGTPSWRLSLALLFVWTLVFLTIMKGLKVFSKVVYVTGLLPCLLLVVLLIRVCLSDGASQGIAVFLRPNWTRLRDLQVWYDAVVQSVFSVGCCYGPLVTLASYNSFSRNIARLSVLLPLISLFSALFMGVVVFGVYGALASEMNTSVDNLLKTGLTMSYTVFPQFTSHTSVPHLWSTLYYLCLVLLTLDTQFLTLHCICNAVVDEFPTYFTRSWRQIVLLATLCVGMYLAGILFVTQGGLYLYLSLYHYLTDITPLLLGVAECLVISWVYGFSHFGSNIWTMIGKHPSFFWRLLWQGITPLLLLLAVVYSLTAQKPLVSDELVLPWGAQLGTWVMCGLTLLCLPVYMVYILANSPAGSFTERLKVLWKPSLDWGPAWETREMRKAWMTLPDYMVSEKEVVKEKAHKGRSHGQGEENQGYAGSPGYDTGDGTEVLPEENSDTTAVSGEGYMENWFPGMEYTEDNIDTGSIQWSQDENKKRGNWAGRYDFLMSGLGYSIGIGNVWRFPYLVYKNGGGAFFLPYLLMLALCGFPLFSMELAFGQFASIGPLTIWKVSPLFKGIGYAMFTTTFLICSYYNVINAWSVLYLFASMTSVLPWTTCDNSWNTDMCHQRGYRECVYLNISESLDTNSSLSATEFIAQCTHTADNVTHYNTSSTPDGTVLNSSTLLRKELDWSNFTTPSEEYFFNYVLSLSSGIDQLGTVQWHLALCLLLCWIVTFAAVIKGIKSVGKVVYVTVVFPFIILLILLIRYATLEGSAYLDGIKYYVTPQWSQLWSASLWGDAASQMFFSLGLSIGGLIALGSFNRFHYDCFKDAYIIVIMDTLTSVFAGFVVFAILGVMANEAGTDVENVVTAKFALAYIAFPEAVTKLPAAPLWSVLFFLMLFTLAIDSQFLMVEGLVVALTDEFMTCWFFKKRLWVILLLCVVLYFLGLPMVSNGGLYILSLMDTYSASWSPVVNGFMLCVVLAWVYKVDNFACNLKVMLGKDIGRVQKFMWKYVTPLVLMFILVFSLVKYSAPTLESYEYPEWAHVLAILTGLSTIVCIPIGALIQLLRSKTRLKEAVKKGCKPHIEWGPALDKHRANCYLPGVIDLNVREWVEKGTYGHVFQTESSGNLDILQELTKRNLDADSNTPVKTLQEEKDGNLNQMMSFSSLHSEAGSVEDDAERMKEIEEIIKADGMAMQQGHNTGEEQTKNIELKNSKKQTITDVDGGKTEASHNTVKVDPENELKKSLREDTVAAGGCLDSRGEETGTSIHGNPQVKVVQRNQEEKSGQMELGGKTKTGETVNDKVKDLNNEMLKADSTRSEKECTTVVNGTLMEMNRETGILRHENGELKTLNKETVGGAGGESGHADEGLQKIEDEEQSGDRDRAASASRDVKEVTFALDLCHEEEIVLVPEATLSSPSLNDSTTQTEESYLHQHRKSLI